MSENISNNGTTATTTCTISEALNNHLHEIKDADGKHAVEGVTTLHGALEYLLDNTYDTQLALNGYDKTLTEPVKISERLLNRIKRLKNDMDARDYEETIRGQANIEQRDNGEKPIKVTKL